MQLVWLAVAELTACWVWQENEVHIDSVTVFETV